MESVVRPLQCVKADLDKEYKEAQTREGGRVKANRKRRRLSLKIESIYPSLFLEILTYVYR